MGLDAESCSEEAGQIGGEPGNAPDPVIFYGYLLYCFYPPENRRADSLVRPHYGVKAGGNGKSLLAKSFKHINPWH